MALTKKQQLFVREYMVDLNATQAYKRAGYSVKSNQAAGVEGHKLLKNPKIKAEIDKQMAERSKRTEITADRVLQEFAKIAFSDIKSVATWNAGGSFMRLKGEDEIDGSLISEIKNTENGIGVKMHDKMKALEALAKHTGVYDDRPQTTVDVGSYVNALWERTAAGDVWEEFNNETPDGDDDGES